MILIKAIIMIEIPVIQVVPILKDKRKNTGKKFHVADILKCLLKISVKNHFKRDNSIILLGPKTSASAGIPNACMLPQAFHMLSPVFSLMSTQTNLERRMEGILFNSHFMAEKVET